MQSAYFALKNQLLLLNQSNKNNNQEKSQIISDLTLLRPPEQTVVQSGGKYIVETLSPKISNSDAEQIVFEHIKQQHDLQFEKVINTKSRSSIRYIPKWLLKFKTISNVYVREILATSKKVVLDDTLFCQSDLHANQSAYPVDKRRAICEICGKIFCRFHIFRSNELYVCEQHQNRHIPSSLDNINPSHVAENQNAITHATAQNPTTTNDAYKIAIIIK